MQSNIKIIRPVISEKSFSLAGRGIYTFIVNKKSGKKQIENEVNKLFKVDAVSVNIVNIPGKVKRAGKKYGKRSDTKKALIRVKPGQKISIFEVEDKKDEKKASKKENKEIARTKKKESENAG